MQIIKDVFEPGAHIYPFAESIDFLRAVGRGEAESALRLYSPAPNVAFGRRDELNPRFEQASQAAQRHGYEPLVRPVGGHAAGYDAGCLVVDHFHAVSDAVSGNTDRFSIFGEMYVRILNSLGVQACMGEIPGEYCPGEYSVHAVLPDDARIKIVGTAQRVVAGAWWFSAGIVVKEHTDSLKSVTQDVYQALDLSLEPSTVGALSDANPLIEVADVEDAVIEAYEELGFC
ncbi:MAG: lipoate--protein ligase family protein [Rothia sp. (in: high G+C Gram-positive bacteria)]|nr:lipoate--protein ligase family protein [Rothia sp. (in: high G+C Gram-positive bacteria)]